MQFETDIVVVGVQHYQHNLVVRPLESNALHTISISVLVVFNVHRVHGQEFTEVTESIEEWLLVVLFAIVAHNDGRVHEGFFAPTGSTLLVHSQVPVNPTTNVMVQILKMNSY